MQENIIDIKLLLTNVFSTFMRLINKVLIGKIVATYFDDIFN